MSEHVSGVKVENYLDRVLTMGDEAWERFSDTYCPGGNRKGFHLRWTFLSSLSPEELRQFMLEDDAGADQLNARVAQADREDRAERAEQELQAA